MEISLIDARDLSEAWFLCLGKALTEGREYKIDRGSYAGQYRSVIGVPGLEALPAAITAVWRSFYSANALSARAAHGGLGRHEAMAVLILPLIDAQCAGVCFSVDPVQRRRDRIVITAAWGLGPGVVDGSVATDTAWVRRVGIAASRRVQRLAYSV